MSTSLVTLFAPFKYIANSANQYRIWKKSNRKQYKASKNPSILISLCNIVYHFTNENDEQNTIDIVNFLDSVIYWFIDYAHRIFFVEIMSFLAFSDSEFEVKRVFYSRSFLHLKIFLGQERGTGSGRKRRGREGRICSRDAFYSPGCQL